MSYMALVRGVDQNVGRILRRIDELGLRERTLVIFCADQGFNCGHHGVWGKGNGTLPFNMYEETLRIPMIWSQPGRIRGGRTLDAMVSSYDFFPTLLDYLGLPPHRDSALAGRSFNVFLGGRAPRWDKRVFAEYAYARMIRSERFKYVQRAGGRAAEFYDLEADPGERRNLIAEPGQRSQVARFKDELATWFAARGAPPIEEWRSTARNRLDAETYTR
jgi:arylsulfatase A-like enzyme